jgi:hemolysin III
VLVLFRNTYGWTVFGAVWAIAVTGIVFRSVWPELPKYVTNTSTSSWGGDRLLVGADSSLPVGALVLLGLGGICYTGGS